MSKEFKVKFSDDTLKSIERSSHILANGDKTELLRKLIVLAEHVSNASLNNEQLALVNKDTEKVMQLIKFT